MSEGWELQTLWNSGVREVVLGAMGCAMVLALLQAWNIWGRGKWTMRAQRIQGEKDDIFLVQQHIVGALEYAIKDGQITAQRLWKVLPKLDGLPGLRAEMTAMVKKYLPPAEVKEEEPKAEIKTHKLRAFFVGK